CGPHSCECGYTSPCGPHSCECGYTGPCGYQGTCPLNLARPAKEPSVLSLRDGLCPGGDFFLAHFPSRRQPGVRVAPALDIDQVLGPGKERSLANPFARRRVFSFSFPAIQKRGNNFRGNLGLLGRVNEGEEDQV